MIEVGRLITVTEDGCNYPIPEPYFTGMSLLHLKINYVNPVINGKLYVVVGRNEFYNPTKLAIVNVVTNGAFIIDENDAEIVQVHTGLAEPIPKPATQEEAVEALRTSIETEINLAFEDEFGAEGRDIPVGFEYRDWYEIARDVAYNLDHILTLRRFIEGE